MLFKRLHILLFPILLVSTNTFTQGTNKCNFNGYLSAMPQFVWTNTKTDSLSRSDQLNQYLLHNRLNFHWYPSDNITASIQFRNQLLYGDFTRNPNIENGLVNEGYFLPLTLQQTFSDAGLLSISTDRAWIQYTHENIELKVGRQRINWGQTFVWNPNDIFNAYSFFDVDYAERPGVDAVRTIYYPNYTSTVELAAKLDHDANLTAAALYRFNKYGIDIQFIGGHYSQPSTFNATPDAPDSDWVGGAGITTDIKGISLRTEGTYMKPTNKSFNQEDLILWSFGVDYSFKNELYINSEFYYSSRINYVNFDVNGGLTTINNGTQSVKSLAFAKYNGFIQASFPITPLFKATLSGMVFSDNVLTGYFIGPYLDYSFLDNLDFGLYFQYFNSKINDQNVDLKSKTSFAFLRIKWSF